MRCKLADLLDCIDPAVGLAYQNIGHTLMRMRVWQGADLDIYRPICLPCSYPVHVLTTSSQSLW